MTDGVSPLADRAGAPDWDAVARYLAGESSAEEAERVVQWLGTHPADKALIGHLKAAPVAEAPVDLDVEAALRRVHTRMKAAPKLTLERGGARRARRVFVAAVLAAAAGFLAFVALRRSPTPATASRVYATSQGQRDSVHLADGSRVILGPDSRLTVSDGFGRSTRSVELEGDAYFDVVHDETKPFSVRVANALIEDVGTTFTVESDPGDTTTVSVMSGVVRLRSSASGAASGALLSAGDRGTLTSDGEVRAHPKVVVADDSAWTTGKLVFRDASLTRVAGELARWYGVRLEIADSSLQRRTVTATFVDRQPVDEVLNVLTLMLGARVDRQGSTATIHLDRGSNKVR